MSRTHDGSTNEAGRPAVAIQTLHGASVSLCAPAGQVCPAPSPWRRAPGADQRDDRGQILGGLSPLLGENPPGGYQDLIDNPEDFLAKTYGKKKIKVNFYHGENFVCTINFKVAGW